MMKKKDLKIAGQATPATKALAKKYIALLSDITNIMDLARLKAALHVNKELVYFYYCMGMKIVAAQQDEIWNKGVTDRLMRDLQNGYPEVEGFSRINITLAQKFYTTYRQLVEKAADDHQSLPIFNLPWGHNIVLLRQVKNNKERLWYAQKALEHSWGRNMLEDWIESDLYNRSGKALTNFEQRLPALYSDMAQQTLKDPYLFDFLSLTSDYLERDVELGLIEHIQKFLLELGEGFSFVGRQYHLIVDENDYYIDLLFYHIKLKCYVVVELKNTPFKAEYAGKLNFYLSAVDDKLCSKGDNSTIGILLCKSKSKLTVEYALKRSTSPIGVASYKVNLTEQLPEKLKGSLPTIKEIEAEFARQEALQKQVKKRAKK